LWRQLPLVEPEALPVPMACSAHCVVQRGTGHAAALPTLLIVAFGSEVGWFNIAKGECD
jgi:hypothetical protein